MMTQIHSNQSNIITIHDAITDSPVYRAATLHFDKQLELFIQWIFDLSKQTKAYAEKLKELNAETVALANKLNPTNIVNYHLIDSQITDIAANNFGNTLKTNLTYKMKMVSDLEDGFTQPIQQFVDIHINDFKDFRKRHEHALNEYENILARHASLNNNNSNDPLASKEDTTLQQQLNTARKNYIELSTEHVIRIVKLRHGLEHCLIEQYSATTAARKDFYNDAQVWKQLNAMLFSWTEWLAEDKRTFQVEIQKQQLAQQTLGKEYFDGKCDTTTTASKSGYLMTRSATDPSSWTRQWFFIHDGYFGSCKVANPEENASIIVDDCMPLKQCQVKPTHTPDRRFCFELISRQQSQQPLFMLQAENQQDLESWIAALAPKSSSRNRPSSITLGNYDSNNSISQPRSPALLIAKSKSTTVVSTPTDIPVTLSSNTSGYSDPSIMSSSPVGTIRSTLSETTTTTTTTTTSSTSLKITWTSLDHHESTQWITAPSMTPLLLCEITNAAQSTEDPSDKAKRWGTPRSIIPRGGNTSYSTGSHHGDHKAIQGRTVWPWQTKSVQLLSVPDIPGYASQLNNKNQELRNLFHGVSPQEVVLDVFIASFLQKQTLADQHINNNNNKKNLIKSSPLGYYYSGSAYITQSTLWFYSDISSNCITTVALKLKDIEEIQVIEDTKLSISIADSTSPLLFSVILDDTETLIEKLRFLTYNAKLSSPMQLRNIYRKIAALSMPSPTPSPSSSSTTSIHSNRFDDHLPSSTTNDPSRSLPSRLGSSNTTTTMDTLVDPPITKSLPTKKTKIVPKPFIDPDTIPSHIEKPSEPITCDCDDHLDRLDAEMELPISAKRLFDLMFSDESTAPPTEGGVWKSKTEGVQGHDLRVSPWEDCDDPQEGQMKRTLKYWMPVANPVVRMKEAEVVETQILHKKEDYLCYVVQISTKTEALPFADAFVPSVRYCITFVDDSRCKLSCYLGVRWLKWVMAKIIVTKAAMAGMSDSVHIFVPILKEAASAVQLTVDNLRQSERDATMTIEYEDHDDNDAMDTVKSDGDKVDETNIETYQKPTIPIIIEQVQSTPPANEQQQSPPPTIVRMPLPLPQKQERPLAALLDSAKPATPQLVTNTPRSESYAKPPRAKSIKTKGGLVKEKLTDASGREAPSLVKAALDSIWPPGIWTLGILLLLCLFYLIPSGFLSTRNTLHHHCSLHEPSMNSTVVSHAVYLRDLDEGFIKKSLQPPYYDSESYQAFIQTRQDERPYTWYEGRHYRFALEYEASREQLGVLRYNMINMFQALSIADADLLETEYLNWLLDSRQRCRGQNATLPDLCDQIINHIGTYF